MLLPTCLIPIKTSTHREARATRSLTAKDLTPMEGSSKVKVITRTRDRRMAS